MECVANPCNYICQCKNFKAYGICSHTIAINHILKKYNVRSELLPIGQRTTKKKGPAKGPEPALVCAPAIGSKPAPKGRAKGKGKAKAALPARGPMRRLRLTRAMRRRWRPKGLGPSAVEWNMRQYGTYWTYSKHIHLILASEGRRRRYSQYSHFIRHIRNIFAAVG